MDEKLKAKIQLIQFPAAALSCLTPTQIYVLAWINYLSLEHKEKGADPELSLYPSEQWGGLVRAKDLRLRSGLGRNKLFESLRALKRLGLIKKKNQIYWKVLHPIHIHSHELIAMTTEKAAARGQKSPPRRQKPIPPSTGKAGPK